MQVVGAEEDAALEQEEEEADAVPHDASLLHGQRAVIVLGHRLGWQAEVQAGQAAAQTCTPKPPRSPPDQQLTVVVALDSADEAEELDHPAEVVLHLLHEDAGQELRAEGAHTALSPAQGMPRAT